MATPIIESLAELDGRYDALFCDLWGCVHDGVRALPEAVAALQAFKRRGGAVVLITNAPRPRASVARQIAGLGVPDDAEDPEALRAEYTAIGESNRMTLRFRKPDAGG